MEDTSRKIYEQANENWRFLAKWRQLAFAGYLAVLAGAASFINSATEHAYPLPIIGVCFLFVAGICSVLWITDRRTHRLTMHACEAGAELEGTSPGFFRVNAKSDEKDDVRHSGRRGWRMDGHTWAALLLFLGSALIFGLAGVVFILTPITPWTRVNNAPWDYTVVHETVTSTITSSDSLEKDLSRAAADGWEFVAMGNDSAGGTLVVLRRHRR